MQKLMEWFVWGALIMAIGSLLASIARDAPKIFEQPHKIEIRK